MKVAEEWTDSAALTNLNQTKILALLDIPLDQRQDFINSNPIDEMTTRQLQEVIKDIEVAPADSRSRENQ
ncbi:DUF3102 domain-containing protein [Acetobacterium bakii]|uniref:Uncharacterized protein n=1 Tax=Acetobacterium bakii TaxID=52689 RepID=A0A0L6TYX6_9FIRM|nr:DUF3102 domain-containing protein [Acetobacterium bakii]KNZ41464.1 hypothetical protein AKG39_11910 [Acetobacterium bakii]